MRRVETPPQREEGLDLSHRRCIRLTSEARLGSALLESGIRRYPEHPFPERRLALSRLLA
jgi:hypothetical protein